MNYDSNQYHKLDYIFLHTYEKDLVNPEEDNVLKYIISKIANVLLFEIFEQADFSPEDYYQDEILQKLEAQFQKKYKGDPEDYEGYENALHDYIEDIYSEPDVIYCYIEDKINYLIENEWCWIKDFKEFNIRGRDKNIVKMKIEFSLRNINFFDNLEEETLINLENIFVNTLNKYLKESYIITHIIKFKDTNAFSKNTELLPKIYSIEMALREVITFILLETFQNKNPYNMLEDFDITKFKKVDKNEDYTPEELSENLENELFLLSFTSYKNFNKIAEFDANKGASLLTKFLRQKNNGAPSALKFLSGIKNLDKEEYAYFKRLFNPIGITNEKYSEFIAGLQIYMPIIEKTRNSIAHNRHLSDDLLSNFEKAHDSLQKHINDFWNNVELYIQNP